MTAYAAEPVSRGVYSGRGKDSDLRRGPQHRPSESCAIIRFRCPSFPSHFSPFREAGHPNRSSLLIDEFRPGGVLHHASQPFLGVSTRGVPLTARRDDVPTAVTESPAPLPLPDPGRLGTDRSSRPLSERGDSTHRRYRPRRPPNCPLLSRHDSRIVNPIGTVVPFEFELDARRFGIRGFVPLALGFEFEGWLVWRGHRHDIVIYSKRHGTARR